MSVVHYVKNGWPICGYTDRCEMTRLGPSTTCPDCLRLLNAPAVVKAPPSIIVHKYTCGCEGTEGRCPMHHYGDIVKGPPGTVAELLPGIEEIVSLGLPRKTDATMLKLTALRKRIENEIVGLKWWDGASFNKQAVVEMLSNLLKD